MKNVLKVALATAAVIGVAKLAKEHCAKDGKYQNHRDKKMAMLDKLRNMNDEEYSQFKEDIKNRNFHKIREQFRSAVKPTEA